MNTKNADAWLATVCRPVILLTLTALVCARTFGWASPGMTTEEVAAMWSAYGAAVALYMGGRTAEKIATSVAGAVVGVAASKQGDST